MSSNKKIIGAGGDVSTSEVKMHSDRILMFDVVGQKKKSGPKSQEPQNIIRRAGGLKGLDLKYVILKDRVEIIAQFSDIPNCWNCMNYGVIILNKFYQHFIIQMKDC